MKKKIVMVANDFAPSSCFERLDAKLKETGYVTALIVAYGKPVLGYKNTSFVNTISKASVVIIGMSSSETLAGHEIYAAENAKHFGVPYGFYGDIPDAWRRAMPDKWFGHVAKDAKFYFGLDPLSVGRAGEAFQNAELYVTGNPLREEMFFPKYPQKVIREKLGIEPETKVVLVPGGKSAANNLYNLTMVIEALTILSKDGTKFQILFATHPGDRTPYAIDKATGGKMDLYGEVMALSTIPIRLIEKNEFSTSNLVPAADIIVELTSSVGIEGACQRIPVISLVTEVAYNWLEKMIGTRVLEGVKNGTAELVDANAGMLVAAIDTLLTKVGFAPMREHQQKVYPKPAGSGEAVKAMIAAIIEIEHN